MSIRIFQPVQNSKVPVITVMVDDVTIRRCTTCLGPFFLVVSLFTRTCLANDGLADHNLYDSFAVSFRAVPPPAPALALISTVPVPAPPSASAVFPSE